MGTMKARSWVDKWSYMPFLGPRIIDCPTEGMGWSGTLTRTGKLKTPKRLQHFFIALLQFFTYLKCWLIFFFLIIDLGGICWLEFGDAQGTVWYFLWKCIWDECCSSPGHYCSAVSRWRSLWVRWSWISVMFPQGAINWSITSSVILEGILYEGTFPWIEQCGMHLSVVPIVNFSRRLICFPQPSLLNQEIGFHHAQSFNYLWNGTLRKSKFVFCPGFV